MEIEESKKDQILNNTNQDLKKFKKKYFRIEKEKRSKKTDEKNNKIIFKTKKDYHLLKRKKIRELKRIKNLNRSKFVTISKENKNNSFFVKKVFPRKLKVIKAKLKRINIIPNLNKNISSNNSEVLKNLEKISNDYKIKLMFVYFSSIKNLCKYINKNFFNPSLTEQNTIDEFIIQIYQSLQILDRKIKQFKPFFELKGDVKVNKEDFYDISSLKENLLLMKNVLNNSMSENLINIYIDVDNFCKVYA